MVSRITAFHHKAAFSQTQISGVSMAAIGQKEPFEPTNICSECASFVKLIASIEDPVVIRKILAHLDEKAAAVAKGRLPQCRAPPSVGLVEAF